MYLSICVGIIRNDKNIPIMNGSNAYRSNSLMLKITLSQTPRITRTNDPEIPGSKKAVNAKSPAMRRRTALLKSNWNIDKAIIRAIKIPTKKLNKYLFDFS